MAIDFLRKRPYYGKCRKLRNLFLDFQKTKGERTMLTNNKNVLAWVDEMVALCKPDKVEWIDGSEAQLQALRDEALATGEMEALYKCLIELQEGRFLPEEEYFPTYVKAHLDRGARLLEQEKKYARDLVVHLAHLERSI